MPANACVRVYECEQVRSETESQAGRLLRLLLIRRFPVSAEAGGLRRSALRWPGVGSNSGGIKMPTTWGLSKKRAAYGIAPRPDVRCDRCKYMFPPLALGGCRLVRGLIRGSATCDKFMPRRRS